jgi:uncharacterized repeat protein (TIGR03837 family)
MAADPLRLRWDLFCRVIDNHGDLGVCWRLARRLAELDQQVRLWIDDASALAWMAPAATRPAGIELRDWEALAAHESPGDVVVETFGGDLPNGWLQRMATSPAPPVWIDVEYLSAESYVERSHALPSPQAAGPGAGLTRWFFYPGFTPRTGGLLLNGADEAASRRVLRQLGLGDAPGASTVSLFAYEAPALDAAVSHWRSTPTRLLACPGAPARRLAEMLGTSGEPGTQVGIGTLTVHWLPWLTQPDYDALLHACDLNFVRGEDSFVQALACGRPFVWQIYPQDDGVHAAKLDAFLDLHLADAPNELGTRLRASFAAWNGMRTLDVLLDLPDTGRASPWRRHAEQSSRALHTKQQALGDLGLRLYRFAASHR